MSTHQTPEGAVIYLLHFMGGLYDGETMFALREYDWIVVGGGHHYIRRLTEWVDDWTRGLTMTPASVEERHEIARECDREAAR